MEFQESEIVSLAVALAFVLSIAFLRRAIRPPRIPLIYAGIFSLVGGHVCTVAEGILWYELFNALEHVCYAASGILFAVGCWRLARRADRPETEQS